MPKFSPGDPVWVKHDGRRFGTVREYPAVIAEISPDHPLTFLVSPTPVYGIEVEGVPRPASGRPWVVSEPCLRPRRDDYQQHEPCMSMAELSIKLKLADAALNKGIKVPEPA